MAQPHISQIQTPNCISWHVEQTGYGSQHILLVPSGEGDCNVFDKVSSLLSSDFTVTTFDMPGFSRSTCEPAALDNLTPTVLAGQIVSLMDALSIPKAIIYGSSSGGLAALAMLSAFESRVQRIIIHEVPFKVLPSLHPWIALLDSDSHKVVEGCKDIFANHMNEDKVAWEALGVDYHKRLERNYITWLRKYPAMVDAVEWDIEGLKRNNEKVNWSVGKLMPMGSFFDNVVLTTKLGISLELLDCKHFPQVSIPELLAKYIRGCCG